MELINFHVIGVGIKKGNGNVKYHDTSYINIYIITLTLIINYTHSMSHCNDLMLH